MKLRCRHHPMKKHSKPMKEIKIPVFAVAAILAPKLTTKITIPAIKAKALAICI